MKDSNRFLTLPLTWLLASILAGCGGSNNSSTTTPPPPVTKNFLYAVGSDANNITAWQIDATTGSLTAISGSPFTGLDAPMGATIDTTSKFLAVDNLNGGTLTVFAVSPSSGSLTPVAGSPFPLASTGGYALSPVFDPLGDYLYICDAVFTSSISVYSVDKAAGTVSHSDTFPVANPIYSLAVHPSGSYLYALGSGGISAFQIDVGGLTELAGSPFASTLSLANAHAVVSPNGKFLVLTDRDAAQLHILALNADGSVGTDVSGSPLSLGAEPLAIATNSTGSVAVVTTDANTVIAIPLDAASGVLGSPGPAATTEMTPFAVVVDAQNKFVYVANQMSNSVSAFGLGSGASLTPVSDSPYSTGKDPIAVVTTRYD